ncbi:MAG: S41 family peptidase [Burkholderiales bacterium]
MRPAQKLRDAPARGTLDHDDRIDLVKQALILLDKNYVHLPTKRAIHAIEPVARAKLLLAALEADGGDRMEEDEFQRELLDIFFSMRDRHTVYTLPDYWPTHLAYLPFMVEEFWEGNERRYMVSKVMEGYRTSTFREGIEIVYWNGMAIKQAVWNYAQRHAGSNLDARHAMGLLNLTLRAFQYDPGPEENWVLVEYKLPNGKRNLLTRKFDWLVGDNPWPPANRPKTGGEDACDAKLAAAGSWHAANYARRPPQRGAVRTEHPIRELKFTEVPTASWRVFRARSYETSRGAFGYIRIWKFSDFGQKQFRCEFIKIMKRLPREGLIIDLRGNPGGKINLAEVILQTLTPRRIEPEPFQFRNTPLNLKICMKLREAEGLEPWIDSIRKGIQAGTEYSDAFPKSDVHACNEVGQKYSGPVVLVTDALTYSAADIFAAGFQDHDIGPVLGVHRTTGAGGANRWTYEKLLSLGLSADSYRSLPSGAGFNVAMRRSLRVGRNKGAILEHFGVTADEIHYMTRRDVLKGNVDLILKAASLFSKPRRNRRGRS